MVEQGQSHLVPWTSSASPTAATASDQADEQQQQPAATRDHKSGGARSHQNTGPQRPRPSLQAQTSIQQLVGDQIPLASSCCRAGPQRSGATRLIDTGDPVPWDPPAAEAQQEPKAAGAAVTTREPKPERMESWDTEDIPDTESEDEAWRNERRRRTAATPMDSTTSPTARRGPGLSSEEPPQQEGAVSLGTHRRRRMHALFDPSL